MSYISYQNSLEKDMFKEQDQKLFVNHVLCTYPLHWQLLKPKSFQLPRTKARFHHTTCFPQAFDITMYNWCLFKAFKWLFSYKLTLIRTPRVLTTWHKPCKGKVKLPFSQYRRKVGTQVSWTSASDQQQVKDHETASLTDVQWIWRRRPTFSVSVFKVTAMIRCFNTSQISV